MKNVTQTKRATASKPVSIPVTTSNASAAITISKAGSLPVSNQGVLRVVDRRYQWQDPQKIAKAIIDMIINEGCDIASMAILADLINGEVVQAYIEIPELDGNSAAFSLKDIDGLPLYETGYQAKGSNYRFNVTRPTATVKNIVEIQTDSHQTADRNFKIVLRYK